MTRWCQDTYGPLFSHFGVRLAGSASETPLVFLNGAIMVDSGNENPTYLFECQDRYPVYASLAGMRCLFLVRDDEHAHQYQTAIAALAPRLATIRQYTGPLLDCDVPEPLYLGCEFDASRIRLSFCDKSRQQLADGQIISRHLTSGIYFHQMAPLVSDLASQFRDLMQQQGIQVELNEDSIRRSAQLALQWHDKSRYVKLLHDRKHTDLPNHVPTTIISLQHLKKLTWSRLQDLVGQQAGSANSTSFFIKSSIDSAGEVCVSLDATNFDQKIAALVEAIEAKARHLNRSGSALQLLVQPRIETSSDQFDQPMSMGFTYHIYDVDRIEPVVFTGHLYEDPERKVFMGTYLSQTLSQDALRAIGENKLLALFRLFAEQGLRGPIHLDAVRNVHGEYVFVYDCNPRLGGSLPGLILKLALRREGLRVDTLASIGYRGRIVYPDLRAKLDELGDMGLLYTRDTQRGAYLVPSIVRPDSYDLILLNLEIAEIRQFIESGLIHTLSDQSQTELPGIYV
jgi:hypothetical protein